jgi:putative DNA primase/helicase
MQRVCGYALTGDTSEQCLFFCYGTGGNGKGKFLETVGGILGEYAATAAMASLNAGAENKHSTDLAMLRGARLVTASETEEGKPWAEARIKELTGQDKITARFMRQDNFTYRPEFKLLVIGNNKPPLTAVDEAIRRRFNMIPFTVKPAEKDPDLGEKLKAEWPQILRWMIDGCIDWQADGLRRPAAVENETAEYFDDQDMMAQWLEEHCTIQEGQWEYRNKAFESFRRFMKEAGEGDIGTKTFTQAIRRYGYSVRKHSFRTEYGNVHSPRVVTGLYLTSQGPKKPIRI